MLFCNNVFSNAFKLSTADVCLSFPSSNKKKVYSRSRRKPKYASVAERFRFFFFLLGINKLKINNDKKIQATNIFMSMQKKKKEVKKRLINMNHVLTTRAPFFLPYFLSNARSHTYTPLCESRSFLCKLKVDSPLTDYNSTTNDQNYQQVCKNWQMKFSKIWKFFFFFFLKAH